MKSSDSSQEFPVRKGEVNVIISGCLCFTAVKMPLRFDVGARCMSLAPNKGSGDSTLAR